jgi:hypothetical protein
VDSELKNSKSKPQFLKNKLYLLGLVLSGLQTINDESPGYLVYPVVFALVKSSGFMILKYAEHVLLHGLNKPFTIPNQVTNGSFSPRI